MANVSANFTVVVAPGTVPLAITPNGGNLPGETMGVTADDQVCVISGGKAPYTFVVSAGTLPPGMQLQQQANADGSVTVFITGDPTQSGAFSFTLTATDSAGATASVSTTVPAATAPASGSSGTTPAKT